MDAPVPALEPVLPRRARRRRLLLLLALGLPVLAIAAFALSRAGDPPVPERPARLAVIDLDGGLSTLDEDGRSIAHHDIPGVTFQFPAWSPDGSRVAAIGRDGRSAGIYVLAGDGTSGDRPAPIYTSDFNPPFYLSWSPDGTRVSFLTTEPGGIALRVAPADASGPAWIVRRGSPFYWDWVDPGRLLVHVGSTGPDAFVGEVDLEGRALVAPAAEPGGFFRAPVVSRPSGHRAWIQPDVGDGQAIVLEPRDGSSRREIPVEGNVAVGFHPTAATLAFIATDRPVDVPPPFPIGPWRVVDAGAGDVRTLVDGLVMAFFWSPDGRTIAALELLGPGATDVEEAAVRAIQPPGVAVRLRFVDVATGATRSERTVRVTDLFAFQVLPFFDQYALSHRVWSPHSAAIVLPIASDGRPDRLVVLPVDGADPRHLADGAVAFWSP